MKFESILIVTYARSGSTLLQGILNSIDGVLIRGENKNFIQGLYEAYDRLKYTRHFAMRGCFRRQNYLDSTRPWYGGDVISIQLFLEYCKNMIRDLLLADRQGDKNIICYGFKEIRYLKLVESGIELADYLNFLNKVFPNVALIFNVRNLDDVVKSVLWRNKESTSTIASLQKLERDFQAYRDTHPENTFWISYEDVISKSDRLKSLFAFLGVEYSETKIDSVLSKPHSYQNRSITVVGGKVVSTWT